MFSSSMVKRYCREDISLIENYEQAKNDETQIWICHHRGKVKTLPCGIKVVRSVKELKENGRYFNCPANELIFLTLSEHSKLHAKELDRKHYSEETKKKMSEAHKGKKHTLGMTYPSTEFGKAYQEHFNIRPNDNRQQYDKEKYFWKKFGKFSWEVK